MALVFPCGRCWLQGRLSLLLFYLKCCEKCWQFSCHWSFWTKQIILNKTEWTFSLNQCVVKGVKSFKNYQPQPRLIICLNLAYDSFSTFFFPRFCNFEYIRAAKQIKTPSSCHTLHHVQPNQSSSNEPGIQEEAFVTHDWNQKTGTFRRIKYLFDK